MMKTSLCKLLLLLCCSSLFGQTQLKVTRFTLANGLQVWLHEDRSRPEVFGAVVVNGGAKLDEADATGMAHYLEHMLFKGTQELGTTDYASEKIHLDKIDSLYEVLGKTTDKEKRRLIQLAINEQNKIAAEYAVPNEINSLLNSIGGRGVNAFTSHDMVVYHNYFPPHQTEKWLELYSHRFINPVFRMFQSELETVYEEKNRSMDGMGSKLIEDFEKAFYREHAYGQRNVLGEVEHLKNPSLITMYKYFDTYYVPNNMALVMSGDFETEKVKALIEEKFSVWQYKELPARKVYHEKDFNGKEVMRGRYVPVKVGVMGYRTVPIGHEDQAALIVINNMLSNENETGLWDKLSLDNKLMFAGMETDIQVDHGKTMLFFVPKIVGQSLKKAETLIMEQLDKLKRGEFDETFLEAVKLNLIRQMQLGYESNYRKALMMAEAFVTNRDWDDLLSLEQKIAEVDKALIVNKVNQYFGENKLVLYSKMGFPKKTKLEKPPFTPALAKGKESAYGKAFREIPDPEAKPKFVDLDKDVEVVQVLPLVNIYKAENPLNDIFSLELRFGSGSLNDSQLSMLATMLKHAGTESLNRDDFKKALGEIGTTYNFYASDISFSMQLQGFDTKLEQSLQLAGQLLDKPIFNAKGRKNAHSNERFERRMEKKDINEKAFLLREYQYYGELSVYLNRMSLKEIKKTTFNELTSSLEKVRQHEINIFYTGNIPLETVKDLVEKYLLGIEPSNPRKKDVRPFRNSDASELLLVNDKKAVQSQLYFFVNTDMARDLTQQANMNAFNQYFGSGMSGLVFQEIREFRSLAYSASASLVNGSIYGNPAYLSAYIGCQADKTYEAMETMIMLIKNMPEKPERLSDIQKSLLQSSAMARPFFRQLGQTTYSWKLMGYDADPNISLSQAYQELTFDDITDTWKKYIQNQNISFAVAGDKKKMKAETLNSFGKVRELKLSDIRKK